MSTLTKILGVALLTASLLLVGCGAGSQTPADQPQPADSAAQPGAAQPGDQPASGQPGGASAGQVAALVNGQPISMEAFNRELARFEAGRAALGYEVSDEAGYRQQVLDLLVEDELIRQLAAEQGITVSDEEVNVQINDMISEYGEDYFNNWLQANAYTREEFQDKIRMGLITDRLLPTVLETVPTTTQHVHARHILVTSQAQAESVLSRLQNGEEFEAVAAEVSTDVTTRDRGGDLGWFPRGGLLVPEVEEAAFSLQPGQISGVVSSAWGYHVVQTLEFDDNRAVDPETQQQLSQQAIDDWRAQLRANATIEQNTQ